MPTVSIGNIKKRINSTNKNFSSSFSANCKLKEPCSMEAPVFIVQGLSKGSFYNYAQFEGRYFWVDDIVYLTNDIQEVHCHLDPLATYKDEIKTNFAWVKYSDDWCWNQEIDDIRMQPEVQITGNTPTVASMFTVPLTPTDGTVIMRVMETATSAHQGVKTYALSYANFKACLADLTGFLDNITQGPVAGFTEYVQTLGKLWGAIGGLGSWRDNILSCTYLPISYSFYTHWGQSSGGMYLGSVPTLVPCTELTSPITVVKNKGSLAIPWSSESQTRKFLKNPRWTTIQIMTPGGYQEVDPTDLKDQQSFGFYSALDICSGEWSCKVTESYIDTGEILAAFSGSIGVDILGMAGTGESFGLAFANGSFKAISAALGNVSVVTEIGESKTTTGSVLTERKKTDGSTTTTLSEGSTTTTPIYHTEGSGISGSFIPSGVSVGSASGNIGGGISNMFLFDGTNPGAIIVKCIQYKPVDLNEYTAYCDRYGYPCNAFLSLNTTNFAVCVGASVYIEGASQASISTINSYLNSGLYLD